MNRTGHLYFRFGPRAMKWIRCPVVIEEVYIDICRGSGALGFLVHGSICNVFHVSFMVILRLQELA